MPLTPFQAEVARLLAVNRSVHSHLAGGAAILRAPDSPRYSNDLDYFQDSVAAVEQAYRADSSLFERSGFTVIPDLNLPGFVRVVVEKGDRRTKVEWAQDSDWRFMPVQPDAHVGYVLHPVDLAINKLLALIGREEPRDFLDVMHLHDTLLPLGAMCWAAPGKDPGFTPDLVLEILRRRGKYRPEDFQRLSLVNPVDVVALKRKWLGMLEDAAAFVESRPAAEAGCLFVRDGVFVQPHAGEPTREHRGSVYPQAGIVA